MKRVFLLMFVSALMVTFGFAQTPDAGSNTDPATVKGCLSGSEGNYTIAEDGTRQIFKVTSSSVDLKPHVGHDVKLVGHKASGAASSGAADNSFAVVELSMISEHCAAAAAASVGAVVPYSQTVIEPATAAPAPSAPASTPAVDASAPAAFVSPSSPAVSAPAVEAAAPAVTVSASAATVSTPTEKAAHSARPSTHARRSATQSAAAPAATVSPTAAGAAPVSPASETVSPASADAATANPSSENASAPAPAATTPTVTHRAGSLSLLISFVVLVIVLGTLSPLLLRWRKRKILERTGTPNLSFTNEVSTKEASSERDEPEPRKVA